MNNLDPVTVSAIVSLGSALVGYWTAKMQTKSSSASEGRKQLSADEETFRKALMEEFKRSREQMDRVQTQNDELVLQNIDMRKKIIMLQEQNDNLIREVTKLREQNQANLRHDEEAEEEDGKVESTQSSDLVEP